MSMYDKNHYNIVNQPPTNENKWGKKKPQRASLGGSWVENLSTNAGDRGSILGLGRYHMPWNNEACVPQILSLCSRAREQNQRAHVLQLLKPAHSKAPPQEKPARHDYGAAHPHRSRKQAWAAAETQYSQKLSNFYKT